MDDEIMALIDDEEDDAEEEAFCIYGCVDYHYADCPIRTG